MRVATFDVMFKRIFVPTDFSACADEALAMGLELAKTFGAHVILAHACESPSTAYMGMMATPLDLITPVRDAAKEALAQSFEILKRRHEDSESMLAFGNVTIELLAAIERSRADLVVMGTHGRTGITHFLLGSVAEKIVRTSPVPVLTVRQRK
jgi:nucleotide-binding universal stress UspA family protein